MTTRTDTPATSPRRSSLPRASPGRASTRPTRPSPSSPSAWRGFAGRVAWSSDNRSPMSTIASSSETATPAPAELLARCPATGEILGRVPLTPAARIEEVVQDVAKVQPLWALLRLQDRARYMRRMAQSVIDDFDELVQELAREQGRPEAEVAALELLAAIDALIWIAEDGAGVVGVIGAGSAPFAQPLGQIAGALLAGNGVVFKPARRACLAGERIARVLARAGRPEGLVRVVHGAADAGERGGKDAMLVLADAPLAGAVGGALWAGCAGAGQARGSIERVFVAREVHERFLAGLIGGARALKVGDPRNPGVQLGPLASTRRAEH